MNISEALEFLQQIVQLHEELRVYYVVDGWVALLEAQDGVLEVCRNYGETIEEAIIGLAEHYDVHAYLEKKRNRR